MASALIGNTWAQKNLQPTPAKLGLISAALPSPYGDIAGLLADAAGYAENPKSLTPMSGLLSLAALAPGIPRTAYHKTDEIFDAFDAAKIGKNDYGYAGRGVYMTPKPLAGNTYGKYALEVEHGIKNPYVRTNENWNTDPLNPYVWIAENQDKYGTLAKASEAWTQMMRAKGYDGFVDLAVENGEIVAFNPASAKILNRK